MVVTEMITAQASTTTALVTSVATATDSATESIPAVVVYTTVTATPTLQSSSPQDLDQPQEHGPPIGSIAGFFVGLFALFVLLGVAFYYWRRSRLRRRVANRAQEASAVQGEDDVPQMSTIYG